MPSLSVWKPSMVPPNVTSAGVSLNLKVSSTAAVNAPE